jgi:segregation and condensation protein B
MSLKAKIEAIIYAAEEPVTIDQIIAVVADEISTEHASEPAESSLPLEINGSSDSQAEAPAPEGDQTLADAKQEAKELREGGRRRVREILEQLTAEYDSQDHGMEIRQVAGGYRMSTKPEHHDVVRSFAKSLKPPMRLSLQALETLAVVAYKQPVTAPEISEIRGVDTSGVLGSLISRKLITTAGRKQVIGRPILYKTTRDFLLRFGLKDLSELPSIEEFEKLAAAEHSELFVVPGPVGDATGVPDVPSEAEDHTDGEGRYEDKAI